MDFAGNIAEFATHSITRRRYPAPSTDSDGARVDGSPTDTTGIDAVVQPIPGEEADQLELGSRTSDARVAYVATEILGGRGGDGQRDALVFDGEEWRVRAVEPWTEAGGYTRAVVVREGEGA